MSRDTIRRRERNMSSDSTKNINRFREQLVENYE